MEIRPNEWGLAADRSRPDPNIRRILFLGGSITLGWGVKEEDTVTEQLRQDLPSPDASNIEVLNGGVGNYNAERYVERFFTELTPPQADRHRGALFPARRGETRRGGGNTLLRNSELAVTLWIAPASDRRRPA